MKTLNQLINDYSRHLQEDNIQIAYKGILDFIGSLRSDFINKYLLAYSILPYSHFFYCSTLSNAIHFLYYAVYFPLLWSLKIKYKNIIV